MTATYRVAEPCWCSWPPLEFVKGECFRCGRWITVDAAAELAESIDAARRAAYAALDAVVERKRLELLDEAEADGIDVDGDREGYRAWLEARMAALDAEMLSAEGAASLAGAA